MQSSCATRRCCACSRPSPAEALPLPLRECWLPLCLAKAVKELCRRSWICVPVLGFLGFGVLFEIRVYLTTDSEGIRGRTAFRGYRQVRWDELVIVNYSGGLSTFKMVDGRGNGIRMSRYLVGHELQAVGSRHREGDREVSQRGESGLLAGRGGLLLSSRHALCDQAH